MEDKTELKEEQDSQLKDDKKDEKNQQLEVNFVSPNATERSCDEILKENSKNLSHQSDKEVSPTDSVIQSKRRSNTSNNINSISKLIFAATERNGGRNNVRLKSHLTGVVQLILNNGGSYIFDWRGDDLVIKEGQIENADCIIEMSASDFTSVVNGDLNIQIMILSDKVKMSGQAGMALYLFNLFLQ